MANPDRGADILDMERSRRSIQSIADSDIDWKNYMTRDERARVVSAESLAEEGKRRLLIGAAAEPGLSLPWGSLAGKVQIRPAKLVLWVGWSHHGKSKLLQQVMLHAMRESERVCVASMEEEMQECWCDMGRMACGDQDPQFGEVQRWITFCTEQLWFYDQQGSVDAGKIKAVVRYCAEEKKITQFVIDSLMMLAVDRDDYEAQSRFIGELKSLAKDTRTTIHLVAHLRKRDGKAGDEQPGSLHEIAGAHDIASKADYVFNVWRDRGRKDLTKPECVFSVEKQRGRINWLGRISLNFHQRSRQFVEGQFPMRFWPEREPGEDG